MNQDLRHYYLQQMGIPCYIVRSAPTVDPLEQLKQRVAVCTLCPLSGSRTNTVFARGNPHAKIMLIGEAPGFHEDKQGLPFVGKAGLLLNKMLASIGLSEEEVYIANVLKCRPPENRDPQASEIQHCSSYLKQQIQLLQPQLLIGLGRFAGHFLTNSTLPLKNLRSQRHAYQGVDCFITYHPAYLLRNPRDKGKAYIDLLRIKQELSRL